MSTSIFSNSIVFSSKSFFFFLVQIIFHFFSLTGLEDFSLLSFVLLGCRQNNVNILPGQVEAVFLYGSRREETRPDNRPHSLHRPDSTHVQANLALVQWRSNCTLSHNRTLWHMISAIGLGNMICHGLILRLRGRSRTFLRHDRSWSRQFFHHDDLAHLAMIPLLGTTVFKTPFATLECCYSILQEKKIAEYLSKEFEDFRQTFCCWTVDILCFLSALIWAVDVCTCKRLRTVQCTCVGRTAYRRSRPT